jgi:hypothetical protein
MEAFPNSQAINVILPLLRLRFKIRRLFARLPHILSRFGDLWARFWC